jgi:hypothetical protein
MNTMQLIASDDYYGVIVEEGLKDPLSLTKLKIKFSNVHLGKNSKTSKLIYHVYSVVMTGGEVEKLPKLLHHKFHYTKFFHLDEVIVVYPNKIFVINKITKSGLEEAYNFGKKLQIGDEHLANLIPKELPKRSWAEIWNDKSIPRLEEKSFLDIWTNNKHK